VIGLYAVQAAEAAAVTIDMVGDDDQTVGRAVQWLLVLQWLLALSAATVVIYGMVQGAVAHNQVQVQAMSAADRRRADGATVVASGVVGRLQTRMVWPP